MITTLYQFFWKTNKFVLNLQDKEDLTKILLEFKRLQSIRLDSLKDPEYETVLDSMTKAEELLVKLNGNY